MSQNFFLETVTQCVILTPPDSTQSTNGFPSTGLETEEGQGDEKISSLDAQMSDGIRGFFEEDINFSDITGGYLCGHTGEL